MGKMHKVIKHRVTNRFAARELGLKVKLLPAIINRLFSQGLPRGWGK